MRFPGWRRSLRSAARRRRQSHFGTATSCRSTFFSARLGRSAGWGSITRRSRYSLNSQREERVNQGGNGNPTRDDRPRAGADHGARRSGRPLDAAVAPFVVLARRRRVPRAADVGGVQRQSGHRGGVDAASRACPTARRSRRAALFAQSTYDLSRRACGWSGRPLRRRELRGPARRTARSSTASRSGRTIRVSARRRSASLALLDAPRPVDDPRVGRPRVQGAAHDRPRHARAHRIGLRGGRARRRGPRRLRRHDRRRVGGVHRTSGRAARARDEPHVRGRPAIPTPCLARQAHVLRQQRARQRSRSRRSSCRRARSGR